MQSFHEWLLENHPEYPLEEWPQWMRKLKKPLIGGALAAGSLLGGADYTRNSVPQQWSAQADYLSAQDDVAQAHDVEDLARIKQGLNPKDHGEGEETQVAAQDSVAGYSGPEGSEVTMPGSNNWAATAGKKAGTRAFWEKGFGQRGISPQTSDQGAGISTQQHNFGFKDYDDMRRGAEYAGVQNVIRKAAGQSPTFPFNKVKRNIDTQGLTAKPYGQQQ